MLISAKESQIMLSLDVCNCAGVSDMKIQNVICQKCNREMDWTYTDSDSEPRRYFFRCPTCRRVIVIGISTKE